MHLMHMIEIFEDNYFTETEELVGIFWQNILRKLQKWYGNIYHIAIIANILVSFSLCSCVRIFCSDSIFPWFHYV